MATIDTGSTHPSLVRGLRRREAVAWDQMIELYLPLLKAWCRKRGVPTADGDDVVQEVLQAVSRGIDQFRFRHSECTDEIPRDFSHESSELPTHDARGDSSSAPGTSPDHSVRSSSVSSQSNLHESNSSTAALPGTFRGWLWTITRNKIHDYHRATRRHFSAKGGSEAAWQLRQHPENADLAGEIIEPTDVDEMRALLRRAIELVSADFEPATWKAFWRSTVDQLPTDIVAMELGTTPAAVRQARSRVLRRLRRQLGDQP